MKYFHIHSLHDGPQLVDHEWLTQVLGSEICSECYSPLTRSRALSIQITSKLEDVPLNIALPVPIGLIRLDLLSALNEEEFRNYFHVGEVVDSNGESLGDFFTFVGKSQLTIRGGPGSPHRECSSCGQEFYHPIGKRHLLESSLDGRPYYESQFNQIIANENVTNQIIGDSWDALKISPLAVIGPVNSTKALPH